MSYAFYMYWAHIPLLQESGDVCAVKVFHDRIARNMFSARQREIESLQTLQHDNIVKLLALETEVVLLVRFPQLYCSRSISKKRIPIDTRHYCRVCDWWGDKYCIDCAKMYVNQSRNFFFLENATAIWAFVKTEWLGNGYLG